MARHHDDHSGGINLRAEFHSSYRNFAYLVLYPRLDERRGIARVSIEFLPFVPLFLAYSSLPWNAFATGSRVTNGKIIVAIGCSRLMILAG